MMTIDQILTKLDHYYKEDQLTEVEPFLLSCLEDAKKEQEYGIYISVGNELLGFYRSIGQFEAAFAVGGGRSSFDGGAAVGSYRPFCNDPVQCGDCVPHGGKYEEAICKLSACP